MLILSDFDGVIASNKKLWCEWSPYEDGYWYDPPNDGFHFNGFAEKLKKELSVQKLISDHDSNIIELIRDKLIIVSGDERVGKAWAEYKQVGFLHTPPYEDKWETVLEYLNRNYREKDGNLAQFAYIGDSLPDHGCLVNATHAFVPKDVSKLLIRKLYGSNNVSFTQLESNGGEGVLEEVVALLMRKGELPSNLLD
jgi:hypothetical protein